MKAAWPPQEIQRIQALRSYAVLDTPNESSFDDLVQLASFICETPIALVSLIDEQRQWFKSRVGLDVPETPREMAFCAHAILKPDEVLQVCDAQLDPRFADNPLVTGDPHIRFYAGIPLVTSSGLALGTLCVIDRTPRELNASQRQALRTLGRQVMALLELRLTLAQRDHDPSLNRKLARAVEQSPVFIVIANVKGEIEYVNPQFAALTGYELQEVIGRNPRFLQSGDKTPDEYKVLWKTITSGNTWRGQFRNRKKNGAIFWEQASISPITDVFGEISHYVAVMEDITERRQIEAQLRAKNEELKGFTYTVSHDLKAPLRGITGYAQELLRKHQEGLGERARFCLTQIETAAGNLDTLIEDLLKYSRLESDTPTPSDFNLDTMVLVLLNDREFTLNEYGTVITNAVPALRLRGWERGLQQVLSNLIGNAIKFSRNAIPPKVTVTALMEAGYCHISVSDNGSGFDMKYHDRIFGLFNRLVRAHEFEGTGAGLAIVKKVLDKVGGSVRAESAPDQGAVFYVSVPCQLVEEERP
ncbi:PAS domain S-box protein [Rhodoferax sp. PAMC 29310]|uniref:GAF domain-containing sensor histidine kinase n=1 Tax=Rhodoferax sp. PAMC 29310 TaxID=2822760 RepID=UPI001B3214B0|nr:PAS domain S-box protein [Rhodoferax sp. PAMC 29310]